MWRPAVRLFDELAVHFVLQLWVSQAHLQSILGQRSVVINRWRLHQHIDEQLTGLHGKTNKKKTLVFSDRYLMTLIYQQVATNTHQEAQRYSWKKSRTNIFTER